MIQLFLYIVKIRQFCHTGRIHLLILIDTCFFACVQLFDIDRIVRLVVLTAQNFLNLVHSIISFIQKFHRNPALSFNLGINSFDCLDNLNNVYFCIWSYRCIDFFSSVDIGFIIKSKAGFQPHFLMDIFD